jgi:YVTN family beta-propeller protein
MRQRERRSPVFAKGWDVVVIALACTTCVASHDEAKPTNGRSERFPLMVVGDAPLPGAANRFDYQEVDSSAQLLIVAHMNDDSVVVLRLADARVVKLLAHIPTPRGIALSNEAGRLFVTSSPAQLVIIDKQTLTELSRVTTGKGPDGVAYDPKDRIVGVSDQADGAISLIGDAGSGTRRQVPLGSETGNVVFDAARGSFWVTVVTTHAPDRLVEVAPVAGALSRQVALPGCSGAHGLRLHPNGQSAFVACEDNSVVLRVQLDGTPGVARAAVGLGPDVMSIDPGLGWLYVAAESGELSLFDIGQPGLRAIHREYVGAHAHSVAVDAATHRVFFPLEAGADGKPILRIMRPR